MVGDRNRKNEQPSAIILEESLKGKKKNFKAGDWIVDRFGNLFRIIEIFEEDQFAFCPPRFSKKFFDEVVFVFPREFRCFTKIADNFWFTNFF